MNKIDVLEKSLSRQLHWIQVADGRIALVLPLATAMLGVLAALLPEFDSVKTASAIFSSFAAFFLMLSISFSALASFPRTEGPKGSLVYFSGINDKELQQFKQSLDQMDEDSYAIDLITQIHINAQIATKKFLWVKRSIGCMFIALFPWIIAVLLLYRGS